MRRQQVADTFTDKNTFKSFSGPDFLQETLSKFKNQIST